MTGYLYKKDLTAMKYAILTSTRHDRTVKEIAGELGIPQIRLRKWMMDRFDMLLLENLPARYTQGILARAAMEDPVGKGLGTELYTRAVPLVSPREMDRIAREVKVLIGEGKQGEEALLEGRKMIREVILG